MLARDGSNFAAWYRHSSQEHQDAMGGFIQALREVLDGFQGIRLERVGREARVFLVVFGEGEARHELALDELSDGQRALMALYALIRLTSGRGYTLLIDEPDNYVSLPEIQPWLVELSDAAGAGLEQAILCSHNPEVIDYLASKHGHLLERETTGVTRVSLLSAIPLDGGMRLSTVIARGWERQ
ncbi:MAG: ATP-binding protein [Deltaproteobacteria bacterium]|nr:ATP-binding protein [Deltaproteobacteria bacterium]